MSSLVLVVPCYNEGRRLPVPEFEDFIRGREDVRICFVNDGSVDDTIILLRGIYERNPHKVILLDMESNCGKAEAVRRGVLRVSGLSGVTHVGFFDADLATPLNEALRLVLYMDQAGASMAFGSRVKRLGIQIERQAVRHYLGRVFATEASLLLGLPVYDTQCGAKVFRRELAETVFMKPFLSRWFFDVEIFFRLKAFFGSQRLAREVIEVPLNVWIDRGGTKVGLMDFLKAPFELLRIWFVYKTNVHIQG